MTGETSRTAPGHVVGFEAPSGHKYYVDPETQQPTWDAPAQAAWKEGHVRGPPATRAPCMSYAAAELTRSFRIAGRAVQGA